MGLVDIPPFGHGLAVQFSFGPLGCMGLLIGGRSGDLAGDEGLPLENWVRVVYPAGVSLVRPPFGRRVETVAGMSRLGM